MRNCSSEVSFFYVYMYNDFFILTYKTCHWIGMKCMRWYSAIRCIDNFNMRDRRNDIRTFDCTVQLIRKIFRSAVLISQLDSLRGKRNFVINRRIKTTNSKGMNQIQFIDNSSVLRHFHD